MIITNNQINLKTLFIEIEFNSLDDFIITIFPDIEIYIKKQISLGISRSDLDAAAHYELERKFKIFMVRNYSKELNEYLNRDAKHASKEVIKDLMLSTLSITLNVTDLNGHKLNEIDYLNSFRNIINKCML